MRTDTKSLGRPRLHLREIGSTNARARELAAAGAPHGTLVTTSLQTAGRGRQGRGWTAPAGQALLLSLVIRDPPALLPLRAGLAVADVAGPDARIKWPNDVLVGGRKVAGDPGRGSAAGGLDRARDGRQRRGAAGRLAAGAPRHRGHARPSPRLTSNPR